MELRLQALGAEKVFLQLSIFNVAFLSINTILIFQTILEKQVSELEHQLAKQAETNKEQQNALVESKEQYEQSQQL